VDLGSGGDHFVDLEPSGDLDVVLEGEAAQRSSLLRLWRGASRDGGPYLETPLGEGDRISLESLMPGHFHARVELGEWFRGPVTLATGDVDVIAGTRSTLTLVLAAVADVEKVAIAGVVRVPKAWKEETCLLTVELLDPALDGSETRQTVLLASARSEEEFEIFEWRLESVQPGRYRIGLHEPPFTVSLVVGSEGRNDIEIVLPPPARVSVRIIDVATGKDAQVDNIHWHPTWPEGVSGGGLESVDRNESSGRFEFDAPETPIEISAFDPVYTHCERTVALTSGLNEVILEVERACGMVLRVLDGESPLAWRNEWDIQPRRVDGDGYSNSWSGHPRGRFVGVSVPGRYRFEFPTLYGYEPVPEQEVLVEAGRLTEHAIRLVRKP
jgi:hypothetical protein